MAHRFLIPESFKLPEAVPLPENLKKKLSIIESLKKEKAEAQKARRQEQGQKRQELRERSMMYEQEYANLELEKINLRRKAKKEGCFYREPESKIVFVIRLKGINKIAPKPKKILQLFRLRQINNGVFIKANKATLEMLKVIHPFVTFGYPSLKTIRNLLYKRGYAKVGRQGAWIRKRILDNEVISTRLGEYGIHGMEDLIHELYTCGPHFKQANNFLWPFKLSCPKGGWTAKRRGFCDPLGGDWGNREALLNELVERMN